jgi:uncharacterized membrane protein YbaN (DUF454 family)
MKLIYIVLGTLTLSLGFVGVALPVLPTTPFLLVSAFFYSRSSDKLNERFVNSWLYQKYLADFIEEKTMTRSRKWTLLIFVDVLLLISFFTINNTIVRIIIVATIIIKHWYFYKFIKVK